MNFLKFKSTFLPLVCFSTNQIASVFPDFNSMNLTRWVKQGDVVRLRRGGSAFPSSKRTSISCGLPRTEFTDPPTFPCSMHCHFTA